MTIKELQDLYEKTTRGWWERSEREEEARQWFGLQNVNTQSLMPACVTFLGPDKETIERAAAIMCFSEDCREEANANWIAAIHNYWPIIERDLHALSLSKAVPGDVHMP